MAGAACLKGHFITSITIAAMAAIWICRSVILYVGLYLDLPSFNLEEISQTVPLPASPCPSWNSVESVCPPFFPASDAAALFERLTAIVETTTAHTQTVSKLKNTQVWHNSNTQIVTKLKNSNFDKTQKLKLGQNSKIRIVTKLKNSNCDKTLKTQIVTTLKN